MIHSTVALLLLLQIRATSVTTEARIVEVTDRGFVFNVEGHAVPAEDDPKTRFWAGRSRGLRETFKVGDAVGIRLKTDLSPIYLRELADLDTWRWLTHIRKDVVVGNVTKADAKWVTLRFPDGTSFVYHATPKSQAQIGGQPVAVASLPEGTRMYVKGRLLAIGETWLVSASDVPPPVKETRRTTRSTKPAPLRLAASGRLHGNVETVRWAFNMLDVTVRDRLLHVTFTRDTRFIRMGKPVTFRDVQTGDAASIAYRRDVYGRLVASKVELTVK